MQKQKQICYKVGKLTLSLLLMMGLCTPFTAHAQDVEKNETGVQDTQRSYDVTKPVIEKVDFPMNGQAIEANGTLPLYVQAYDAESGIKKVQVRIVYKKGDATYGESREYDLTYNEIQKRYELDIDAWNGGYTSAYIASIRVIDQKDNYAEAKVNNEAGLSLYTFTITGGVDENPATPIEELNLAQNGKEVKLGDTLSMSITIPQDMATRVDALFANYWLEGSNMSLTMTLTRVADTNVYQGTKDIDQFTRAGKWTLRTCGGYDPNTGSINFTYPNMDSTYFTLPGEVDKTSPVITSIEVNKNKQFVQSGDVIEIRIKAKDDVALNTSTSRNSVSMIPTSQIATGYKTVNLEYEASTDTFVGSVTITDDFYPCEWYFANFNIYDTSDNPSYNNSLGSNSQYYIKVKQDDNFVAPTVDNVNVIFQTLNEDGDYESIQSNQIGSVERRTTLEQLGITIPTPTTSNPNLKFIGWIDREGNPVTKDTEIVDGSIYAFAKYDKQLIRVSYEYPTQNLDRGYSIKNIYVDQGTTYKTFLDSLKDDLVTDLYDGEQFESWKINEGFIDYGKTENDVMDSIPTRFLNKTAHYTNKIVVSTNSSYIDTTSDYESISKIKIVDEGTTYETVNEQLLQQPAPTSFAGLRFREWKSGGYMPSGIIKKDYDNVFINAVYENYILTFDIDDHYRPSKARGATGGFAGEPEFSYAMVAELGDEISMPTFSDKYKSVTWVNSSIPEGGKIVVDKNYAFYGYGIKTSSPEQPEQPAQPDKPTVDGGTIMEDALVEEVVSNIKTATNGSQIDIPMGDTTVIPKDVLAAAKGKDILININMGGYSWKINGKDILAEDLKNINLEVSFDKNAIPNNTVKALAGENPVKQISLTHEGDFGFKANLVLNMGSEYTGKYGNLYYHDSEGKLVFMNAGKIAADGSVVLGFSHASDYVIIINDQIMGTPSQTQPSDDNIIKQTGEQSNTPWLSISFFVGVLYVATKRKKIKA